MDSEHFRSLLQRKQAELEEQLEGGRDAAKPVELDQSRVGRVSRMDAMQEQAMSVEAQRRRKLNLARVRAALRRLDDGEFGICLECGEPIAERRLELEPAVTLCIGCARLR